MLFFRIKEILLLFYYKVWFLYRSLIFCLFDDMREDEWNDKPLKILYWLYKAVFVKRVYNKNGLGSPEGLETFDD